MNKLKLILIISIIIVTVAPIAKADENALELDAMNSYSDMEVSYMDGYSPETVGREVRVLLPLVNKSGKNIDRNRIKVTFDLGNKTQTPFYIGYYTEYFWLGEHKINSKETLQEAFLIDYDLPLVYNRVNGSYPVIVKVEYKIDDEQYCQEFIVYVNITDGKDRYEYKSDKEKTTRNNHSAPDIIICEYSFSEDVVQAGDDFQVYLTLENTSDKWHAHNIRLDCDGETTDIISTDKNGSFFIDELENKEQVGVLLNFRVRQDSEAGAQKITLKMSYEDNMNNACASEDDIIIEIQQPIRLEHDDVNIPKSVNAGDSLPITMQVYNMGKSHIYNVLVEIAMPGVIPDGSAYLGNMESGDSGTAEIYAFFGTLDMGKNGLDTDIKYGPSAGTVILTYEDEFGELYEELIELQTIIERPVFDDIYNKKEEPEEEPEKMSSWWISIGILVVLAAGILGITSYRRKVNQLKREYGHLES